MIAGKVFRIVGKETGHQFASGCLPESDDLTTLQFIHNLFSIALTGVLSDEPIDGGLEVQFFEGRTEDGEQIWATLQEQD
jgi:hypothetical protein